MKNKNTGMIILTAVIVLALAGFLALYIDSLITVEEPWEEQKEESSLEDWTVEESASNGKPLREDKGIYEINNNLYDVYLSVFPTKDENGKMLDFSAFALHKSRDHSYNPILNCNIQILPEGKKPDPLVSLDKTNATIRVRGNSSRGDLYKSYKVKLLNEKDSFFGQTNLNINKHSEDIAKVSTKLCSDLLSEVPNVASYRTYFMRVWIRDASLPEEEQKFQYYGLYTQIEQPNKTYLETRGLPTNAVMYKARNFNFSLSEPLKNVDDPSYDETEFESILGIREGKDHDKLLKMLEELNDETNNFDEVFRKYFNEDNYLTFMAFSILTGNDDIINHNFLLYSPENTETWYFIPWDFDGALRFGEHVGQLMRLPECLQGGQKLNQSILHRRYLRMDGSHQKIQAKMEELLDTVITEEKMNSLIDGYLPVLEKTMTLDPDLMLLEMSPDQLPGYLRGLHAGMVSNYETFLRSSQYPVPMFVAKPERNEDGSLHLAWAPSFSYQGRTISYKFSIYSDYSRSQLVAQADGILDTQYDLNQDLPAGIYYLDVRAVDSEGHEQLSMERYETMVTTTAGLIVNGLLEFEIR